MAEFVCTKYRLDVFYFNLLCTDDDDAELWSIVKLVLMLSHGNASLESGFSVNSDILLDNLHEESLVTHQIVYDDIQTAGGILKVDIIKTLQQCVRTCYDEALKKNHGEYASDEQKAKEKKS